MQQQKRNVTRMISLILAEKIFSLFLIMFMGYAVVHWGLLHAEDSKTLSLISLYLISPCVIISAFQVQYTPDVLHGLLLALAAAVLLHVGIIVVVNLLGHALHLDAVEKASMIYSNAGNLIIPIVTAVLGKEWVIYSSAFLSQGWVSRYNSISSTAKLTSLILESWLFLEPFSFICAHLSFHKTVYKAEEKSCQHSVHRKV